MKTALRKVWRDLWRSKGRTLLVVMSITAGVLAVGMIVGSNTLMQEEVRTSNAAANPSHGRLSLDGGIDEETLYNLERLPGILLVDGRLVATIQWKTSPDAPWENASLRALPDYEHQKFDFIELFEGSWPERDGLLVAYNQIDTFGVPPMGGTLIFKVNDRERMYDVSGVIRDPNVLAPPFDETATFYVSKETFANITGFDRFTQIRFTVPVFSEAAVQAAADEIDRTLNRVGVEVSFVNVNDPADHWAQATLDGVGLILTIMAISSLTLSTFLIVNTMNALMVQQVPQIGMMKTVGGLSRQIVTVYLAGVAVYGLLALLIAVPAGAAAGDALTRWLLVFINVPPGPFRLVPQSLQLQIATGLMAPLVAGFFPILRGVSIPVARAISSYGIGQGQYGFRLVDRIMTSVRFLPRLATVALRNTFRRPGRVALTQVTLTIAGAIFMMVLSTQQSFLHTIDEIFAGLGFDVILIFEQPQRIDEIVTLTEAQPGITHAEMWAFAGGIARPAVPAPGADGLQKEIDVRGFPSDTELFVPQLVSGRNLLPEDGHAILFNQKIAAELGLDLGDQVVLELEGYPDTTWTIVGLVLDLGANAGQRSVYVHLETLNRDLNLVGRSRVLEIAGAVDSIQAQRAIESNLTDFFESQGLDVAYTTTALENKDLAIAQFSILTQVLLIMTVLIATVGGIGLSGTLSINVIERTREIGVMRAVGASSIDIGRIFMGEGLLLGLISWLTAIPLSAVAGRQFVAALGTILEFPFEYRYSSQSIWLWFGIIVALSIGASWLPARRATHISVRESLAYE